MTIAVKRHIRENLRSDSPVLCGGGRTLDLSTLKTVSLSKWSKSTDDCGRCVRVMKARKEK